MNQIPPSPKSSQDNTIQLATVRDCEALDPLTLSTLSSEKIAKIATIYRQAARRMLDQASANQ